MWGIRWLVLGGLFTVATTASAQPTLTPDRPVDAPLVTRALLDQEGASIAFGGGVYLAVWRDGKNATPVHAIHATRVTPAGVVMDDPALVIADQGVEYDLAAVGFDGKRFLVAWTGPGLLTGKDIFGAYVDPATAAVTVPFKISSAAGTQDRPTVAGGNGYALVTWGDGRAVPPNIYATLFNDLGATLKAEFKISQAPALGDDAVAASVVWGGTTANNFLVTWAQGTGAFPEIFASFVDVAGTVTPAAPFRLNEVMVDPYGTGNPTVTTDGTKYLVAWSDLRDDPVDQAFSSLYGVFVPFTGPPVADADFAIAAPTGAQILVRAQSTFAGGKYLLVWEAVEAGQSLLFGARLNSAGVSQDGNGVRVSSAPASVPDLLTNTGRRLIATDGTKTLTAWTQRGGGLGGHELLGLPIDPSAVSLSSASSILLSRGRNYQIARSAASNGSVFLLVWEDNRNIETTGVDIYGLRIDAQGTPLDAAPFAICTAPKDQFLPTVAARPGGTFLVAWSDARNVNQLGSSPPVEIYAARVGSTGAPMDANGFLVRNSASPYARLTPAVAAGSDGWLIAWEDWRSSSAAPKPEIYAATISASAVVGTEQQITFAAAGVACAPAAVWNGNRYFVAYEQPCSQLGSAGVNADLKGRWVQANGTVKAGTVVLASNTDPEIVPQLAADNQARVIAVWRGLAAGGSAIRGGIVLDDAGALSKSALLTTGNGGDPDGPSVVVSGGTVLVAWVEANGVHGLRADGDLVPVPNQPPLTFASGVRSYQVNDFPDPADTPLTGQRVAFTQRSTPPMALAAMPSGEVLVGYDLLERLAGKDTARVHQRKLGIQPRGIACTVTSGCSEGICTGGFCCDTPCDGICQRCGANGCVETPVADARCGGAGGGVISCAALSTECRTYQDQPMNRCAAFNLCIEPGSLSECDTYTDAPDGTACASAAGGEHVAGACRAGVCDVPYRAASFPLRTESAGCGLAPGARPGGWPIGWALLAVLALGSLSRVRATARGSRARRSCCR